MVVIRECSVMVKGVISQGRDALSDRPGNRGGWDASPLFATRICAGKLPVHAAE